MNHVKLDPDIQKRVQSYYDLLWNQLKGQDDTSIIAELPESLQTDLKLQLFACFADSGFLPKENGTMLEIVRRSKLRMVCAGEIIM